MHKDYKLPPSGLPYLPPDAIQQFRETLVFSIKKKLSLNFKKSGKQSIKIPCSESQFVGVFGSSIYRYSPCRRKYICIFKGQNANMLLSMILKDNEWGERLYDLKQKAYVVLYNSSIQEDQEMIVEWHIEKITNIHQQTISTGFIVIKFQIDTVSYQTQRE